jgi:hypothetical protein
MTPPHPDYISHEESLYKKLGECAIEWTCHAHEPIATVAQSTVATSELEGLHLKTLFLRDKKKDFFC